jgi:hypothetical protein
VFRNKSLRPPRQSHRPLRSVSTRSDTGFRGENRRNPHQLPARNRTHIGCFRESDGAGPAMRKLQAQALIVLHLVCGTR